VTVRVRRSGEVRVALPPERAIHSFTAEGERAWAPGWAPEYPAGDEDAPGTVFTTAAGGVDTVWVILERTPLTAAYARVAPGRSAGTVSVALRPDGEDTVAEVAYDLTALDPAAGEDLERFAAAFDDMLGEWERLIGAMS
jgi:hypothetical protein